MKKLIAVFTIVLLLACAGCSAPASQEPAPPTPEVTAEIQKKTPASTPEPTPEPTPELLEPIPPPEPNIVAASVIYDDTGNYQTASATVTVTLTDDSQLTDVITGNCYSQPRLKDEIYIADLDLDGDNELIVNVGVTGSTYGAADTVIYDFVNGELIRVLDSKIGPSVDSYHYGGGASAEVIEDIPYVNFTAGMNLGSSVLSYHEGVWEIVE